MSTEFDVKLSANDMYAFNMYHAYTSVQGIVPVVLGIAVLTIACISDDFQGGFSRYLYMLIGLVFIIYIPLSLWMRARRVILMDDVLGNPIHYNLCDEGVVVTAHNGESATLEWQYVYKAVSTKKMVYIFSNRVNAYIIPKAAVGDKLDDMYAVIKANVPDYRVKLK